MIFFLNAPVRDSGGRTVLVYPERQMVESRLFCDTAVLTTPGVHTGSGRGCPSRVNVCEVSHLLPVVSPDGAPRVPSTGLQT